MNKDGNRKAKYEYSLARKKSWRCTERSCEWEESKCSVKSLQAGTLAQTLCSVVIIASI